MGFSKQGEFRIKQSRLGMTGVIFVLVVIIFALIGWSTYSIQRGIYEEKRAKRLAETVSFCEAIFSEDQTIKSGISREELDDCRERLTETEEESGKIELLKTLTADAIDYLNWDQEASSWLDENGIVKDSITEHDVVALDESAQKLSEGYQSKISEKFEFIKSEYNKMTTARNLVTNLFTSTELAEVRTNVNRDEYNDAKNHVDELSQENLKNSYNESLGKVLPVIEEQERIARERAEAERKRREEEQRKIRESWHKLDLSPYYLNQYTAQIYNGCEAASLLMAMHYKGYARGTGFKAFVDAMPKTEDPNTGFYLSIYDLEPRDEAHWIAPSPLAVFGRSYGGNASDATGWSLDRLDQEIANGNPVVIYLTYAFRDPKNYSKGVPKNLHVIVLAGYNSYTGEQLFYDPWPTNGVPSTLSKARTEYLFAASGRRAVVVR